MWRKHFCNPFVLVHYAPTIVYSIFFTGVGKGTIGEDGRLRETIAHPPAWRSAFCSGSEDVVH